MKITSMSLIVLVIILITGCSSKEVELRNYLMKGESQHWYAEYKGHSKGNFYKENGILKYKGDRIEVFTLTYKGELKELSSVKEVAYSFGGHNCKESFGEAGPFQKVFTWRSEGPDGIIFREDNEKAKVSLDGQNETIEMKIVK